MEVYIHGMPFFSLTEPGEIMEEGMIFPDAPCAFCAVRSRKGGEMTMNWLEIIQLRSYSQANRDDALAAFQELVLDDPERGLGDIVLLRNITLDNDLCLSITWNGGIPDKGKSALGLQLAAAFSEFGQINHSVWVYEGSVPLKVRRTNHEEPH